MSSKKLKKEEKEWALSTKRFKTVSDDTPVDITKLSEDDKGLYYKDMPCTTCTKDAIVVLASFFFHVSLCYYCFLI